jgi:SAM-dependent methyltransferase
VKPNQELARSRRPLTKNRMGWASAELNTVSRMFVEYCMTELGPADTVLDIGAAFGVASLAALVTGVRVVANDLDAAHLAELDKRVSDEERTRLELKAGRFPKEIGFDDGTLAAVHASNVFHFLRGRELDGGMRAIERWLCPGGKLFVQAATPFQSPFEAFLPEYARRVEAGLKWPGWIEKVSVYSTHKKISLMPRSVHLLDEHVLRRMAEDAGLVVEEVWLYRRADLPKSLHLDERESVGLVAIKPGGRRAPSR